MVRAAGERLRDRRLIWGLAGKRSVQGFPLIRHKCKSRLSVYILL